MHTSPTYQHTDISTYQHTKLFSCRRGKMDISSTPFRTKVSQTYMSANSYQLQVIIAKQN